MQLGWELGAMGNGFSLGTIMQLTCITMFGCLGALSKVVNKRSTVLVFPNLANSTGNPSNIEFKGRLHAAGWVGIGRRDLNSKSRSIERRSGDSSSPVKAFTTSSFQPNLSIQSAPQAFLLAQYHDIMSWEPNAKSCIRTTTASVWQPDDLKAVSHLLTHLFICSAMTTALFVVAPTETWLVFWRNSDENQLCIQNFLQNIIQLWKQQNFYWERHLLSN